MAAVVGLIIGGYWTYLSFIKHRENYAFVDFTVHIDFIGKQGDWWIVELVAYLENKGKVQHRFSDLRFNLDALFIDDPVEAESSFGGQAYFPHLLERDRAWIPEGQYFIEPGLRNKYSYVVRVPAIASFLMLHGTFTYQDQKAWHSSEQTVQVPTTR